MPKYITRSSLVAERAITLMQTKSVRHVTDTNKILGYVNEKYLHDMWRTEINEIPGASLLRYSPVTDYLYHIGIKRALKVLLDNYPQKLPNETLGQLMETFYENYDIAYGDRYLDTLGTSEALLKLAEDLALMCILSGRGAMTTPHNHFTIFFSKLEYHIIQTYMVVTQSLNQRTDSGVSIEEAIDGISQREILFNAIRVNTPHDAPCKSEWILFNALAYTHHIVSRLSMREMFDLKVNPAVSANPDIYLPGNSMYTEQYSRDKLRHVAMDMQEIWNILSNYKNKPSARNKMLKKIYDQ